MMILRLRIGARQPDPDSAPVALTPAATIRRLEAAGWSHEAAGNVAAYLNGITPSASGWSLGEIQSLLFLRAQRARWPG